MFNGNQEYKTHSFAGMIISQDVHKSRLVCIGYVKSILLVLVELN